MFSPCVSVCHTLFFLVVFFFFFLMIRRPPRSTHCISSAASDVYKRQMLYLSHTPAVTQAPPTRLLPCIQQDDHAMCRERNTCYVDTRTKANTMSSKTHSPHDVLAVTYDTTQLLASMIYHQNCKCQRQLHRTQQLQRVPCCTFVLYKYTLERLLPAHQTTVAQLYHQPQSWAFHSTQLLLAKEQMGKHRDYHLHDHPHVLCVDTCLLYTSDAADDMQCVDLGGRRIIKKKKKKTTRKNKV
eukprot:TRINITY_DN2494_c0_g1_i2.p1 TRINITY_DN2494_c0_g1~~TRINITY_DN2494_c0_g1_i2.p1  ORF type:complete len:241 (-),score=13.38 TRINITY_DN2494_c0_g1_i2:80-802(-)